MKKTIIKVLLVVLVVVLSAAVFVSCAKDDGVKTITISMPDGAPALAMAKLMKEFTYEGYIINYEIVPGANEITAKLSQKTADIAIIPTNIASKLYSNGIDIRLISANVFGVLYLVGTEEATSLSQLKGQKIQCIGQGGTPEFMLRFILESNGIDPDEDVTIEFRADGSEIIPLLKTGKEKFAVLGEPAATMSGKNAGTTVLFDLQSEWEKLTGFEGYPQASVVVSADALDKHSNFLKAFVNAMKDNAEWIKTNSHDVNLTLQERGSAVSFSSDQAIANCNIAYVKASEAKENIKAYLETMQAYDDAFVGAIPDDAFYVDIE